MITIIHTSDWHIGQTFFSHNRDKEHIDFLNWLIQVIADNKADVLLIAGDVFDVSNPSSSAQKMFYKFIQKVTLRVPNLQIIVTAGNHDSPSRIETPLPLLDDKNVVIKGIVPKVDGQIQLDKLITPLYNKEKEVEAFCLTVPYLRQGDYPRVDAPNPYASGIHQLYEDLFSYVNRIKTDKQGVVAMGHLQAIGSDIAEKDHSEKMIIGGLEAVSPSVFSDFNYTALGHIHKAQRLAKQEHIRYAGSPLPMSFAEKNYKHGVVKVTLDRGITTQIEKLEYQPLVNLISIPSKGSASPSEVMDLLSDLPNKEDGLNNDLSLYPFLEVRVLLTEPEPLLTKQIADIIDSKRVRLARVVNDFQRVSEESESVIINQGLDELTPLDIADRYYKSIYNEGMPEELKRMFEEVCIDLNREGGSVNHEDN